MTTPLHRSPALWIAVYVLALAVAYIAARVEYLNAAGGGILPRAPADFGEWRAAPATEAFWRASQGLRDESGAPLQRELTADERRRMVADLRQVEANGKLRDWVGSAGLLQYLLLPMVTAGAIVLLAGQPSGKRLLLLMPIFLIVALAAASLWHRAYFTSLGW